jgi:hypothetical protein
MYSHLQHDSFQRLHDAARREAGALRRQAINDFWRQLGRAVRRGLRALRRPAGRPQLAREA